MNLSSIAIGIVIGLGLGANLVIVRHRGDLDRQEKAIQFLCQIEAQRMVYETGHDLVLDCDTLKRL